MPHMRTQAPRQQMTAIVALTLLCALLTACSRGPSEQAIAAAYTQEVNQANKMSAQFGQGIATIQVNAVKKLKCSEYGNRGAFRCQVDLDTTLPMIGRTQNQTTLILRPQPASPAQGETWVIDRQADSLAGN